MPQAFFRPSSACVLAAHRNWIPAFAGMTVLLLVVHSKRSGNAHSLYFHNAHFVSDFFV